MLTVQEIATYAGVEPASVYRWLHSGALEGRRLGDTWRVIPGAIKSFAVCTGGEELRDMEPLLTLDDAAPRMAVKPLRLLRLVSSGRFPGVRLGKLWRVTARAVDEFLSPTGPGAGTDPVVGVDRLPRPGAGAAGGLDDVGVG
ncbi:MAG: excisionase family DNA-binding protein [Myxococcota bacterium]